MKAKDLLAALELLAVHELGALGEAALSDPALVARAEGVVKSEARKVPVIGAAFELGFGNRILDGVLAKARAGFQSLESYGAPAPPTPHPADPPADPASAVPADGEVTEPPLQDPGEGPQSG